MKDNGPPPRWGVVVRGRCLLTVVHPPMFTVSPPTFVQLLSAIHHCGTRAVPEEERYRVRLSNLVALLGAVLSTGYSLFYLFGLHAIAAFAVNNLFVLAYLAYFGWLLRQRPQVARSWLAATFGVQILLFMLVFFDRETGLQLFLVAGCPIAFLVFGHREQLQRNLFCVLYLVGFLVTEWVPSLALLGPMPDDINRLLYLTTVVVVVAMMVQVMEVFLVEMDRRTTALQELAVTDSLTGLNNRRGFVDKVKALRALSGRTARPLSIIMVDIDHFKQINDRYGHTAGDAVLVAVARALRVSVRREDVVGRMGGEEFALALSGSTVAEALATGEALRARIAQLETATARGVIRCTISVGVDTVRADDPGIGVGMGRADTALYRAKQQGRNQVCELG